MRNKITEEEKIAKRLENLLCDLRVDIEQVGRYLARTSTTVGYNRLMTVAESAQFERESKHERDNQYTLF